MTDVAPLLRVESRISAEHGFVVEESLTSFGLCAGCRGRGSRRRR